MIDRLMFDFCTILRSVGKSQMHTCKRSEQDVS